MPTMPYARPERALLLLRPETFSTAAHDFEPWAALLSPGPRQKQEPVFDAHGYIEDGLYFYLGLGTCP